MNESSLLTKTEANFGLHLLLSHLGSVLSADPLPYNGINLSLSMTDLHTGQVGGVERASIHWTNIWVVVCVLGGGG